MWGRKFIFLLIILIAPGIAHSIAFYDDCILWSDFGDRIVDHIKLTPVKPACLDICNVECHAFSRRVGQNLEKGIDGAELNEDIIKECFTACQKGQAFQSRYYEVEKKGDGSITYTLKPPVKIADNCSALGDISAEHAVHFKVNNGDKIKLTLGSSKSGSESNRIVMCGQKAITLKPIFKNITAGPWDNNIQQTMWNNRTEHPCLPDMPDTQWNSLTNLKLWNNRTSDKCTWSARNYNSTDTGIYLMEGDELSIIWQGDYGYKIIPPPSWNLNPPEKLYKIGTRQSLIQCIQDPKLPNSEKVGYDFSEINSTCKPLFQNISKLIIDMSNGMSGEITGEDARTIPMGTTLADYDSEEEGKHIRDRTWNGLQGFVRDIGLLTTPNLSLSKCSDKKNRHTDSDCSLIKNPGLGYYQYSGIFKVEDSRFSIFQNQRSSLYIRHFEPPDATNYSDNVGGYDVDISWAGCPIRDGRRVQYAVIPTGKDSKAADIEWKDIKQQDILESNYFEVEADTEGYLYFKVEPISPPFGANTYVEDLYSNPANRFGQYYITVEKQNNIKAVQTSGPRILQKLLGGLLGLLINDGSSALQNLVQSITGNAAYQQTIRALMVLYFSFFSIGFLLGIIQLDQQNAVIRLGKIAIVCALISPQSWMLFGSVMVKLFIGGSLFLILQLALASFNVQNIDTGSIDVFNISADDLSGLFTMFDAALTQLFSANIWIKIYGLLVSGVTGFITAIIITIAIVLYVIGVVKVAVMFAYAIVGTSLLIVAAPVFIPMILFERTKEMFEQWWKHLLSFALQPAFVFAAIALFNLVFMALLYIVLSFTVCPMCLLEIKIPLFSYDSCVIPGYTPLMNVNMPSGATSSFYTPTGIGVVLSILLVAWSVYKFIPEISNMVSRMITGGQVRNASIGQAGEDAETAVKATASKVVDAAGAVATGGTSTATSTASKKIAREGIKKAAAGVGKIANQVSGNKK